MARGPCRGRIQETERRTESGEREFHARAQETSAEFLVIKAVEECACRGKQGK